MRALVSWLEDLVEIPDDVSPEALAWALHMAGFELAALHPIAQLPRAGDPAVQSVPATDRSGAPLDHAAPDAVMDLEITANRPDCLSMIGIAREVSALYDVPMRTQSKNLPLTPRPPLPPGGEGESAAPTGNDGPLGAAPHASEASGLRVTIEDPALCPRYAAAVADVTVGPSPAWLVARLEAAGLRSINNIVDVTNYVLLETGHPLHGFDLQRLDGAHLRIRRAQPGERVKTLDGQERTLAEDMLVIADASRPQAVAGVMGGGDSEVTDRTTVIALESAYFSPSSIRRTSKRLGLSTDASYRFERGADPDAPARALARACGLIEAIGAGRVRPDWIDARATTWAAPIVTLQHEQIARVLGFVVPPADVVRILGRLGFTIEEEAPQANRSPVWRVTVPSWRVDVSRDVDLIEEVARQYGYERIPTTFPPLELPPPAPDARLQRDRIVRQVLRDAGFHEAATLAFIERAAARPFADDAAIVAIMNPLSEKVAVLRPSLLPGLVDSLAHNRRREQRDVRLFEVANGFLHGDGERRRAAAAATGHASAPHWSGSGRLVDAYDLSGALSTLAGALGLDVTLVPAAFPFLSPSCSAAVHVRPANGTPNETPGGATNETAAATRDSRAIGAIGQLRPEVADARGLPSAEPVYVFEIDLDAAHDWIDVSERLTARPLPRHPSMVRDVSIAVNADLPAAQVRDTIRATAPATLERVIEFDRYQGKGVAEGQCSLSLRLTFRAPDRTLTDADVQDAMDRIVAALARAHGATLR